MENNILEKDDAKVKEFYNKFPYPKDNPDPKGLERNQWILNSLPSPIKPGSKILDLGCGTGEISCYLSRFGDVKGIDFSEESIKEANKLKEKLGIKNIEFIVGDIMTLDLQEKFDYIFSVGVLHHIVKVEEVLDVIRNHMHQDSLTILAVYNKYGKVLYKLRRPEEDSIQREMDGFNHPYEKFYTTWEFKQLLERNEFKFLKMWRNIPEFIRLITGKGRVMTFCSRLLRDGDNKPVGDFWLFKILDKLRGAEATPNRKVEK